jgi:putative DNA primase/helicase
MVATTQSMPLMSEMAAQFLAAIADSGLTPPETIIADGERHRFSSNGEKGDTAGWYILFPSDVLAGAFGCWRQNFKKAWRANADRQFSTAERATYKQQVRADREIRRIAEAARQEAARQSALTNWANGMDAAGHPYLALKNVRAHGTKQLDGQLMVPMFAGSELTSIQFIGDSGSKRFLAGGRVKGCSHTVGHIAQRGVICMTEGFATSATIHEVTGYPVVAAFSANNIAEVARDIRERYPLHCLVFCADDDHLTPGNPGITKATEAARLVNGTVVVPLFNSDRPAKATDFNDMAALMGNAEVKRIIEAATTENDSGVSGVAGVHTLAVATSGGTPLVDDGVPACVSTQVPQNSARPAFAMFPRGCTSGDGRYYRPGVWHFGFDRAGEQLDTWVSGPLEVVAVTRDDKDNHFGRMLRFTTTLGRSREWAMPMDMLSAQGEQLRAALLSMGLEITWEERGRRRLMEYLQMEAPDLQMRCVHQVGWHNDAYVLPDEILGKYEVKPILQTGDRHQGEFGQTGTLEGWRTEVAAHATGNPLLMLAICAAFAGPVMKHCRAESGGIHLVGDSSTGKTTALRAACSVWGGEEFRKSWRATGNGIEGVAAMHNDCLLVLDEISECGPKEVPYIVYSLGNGRGKQRATRTGQARPATRFCCFILSSGERTIGATMAESGQIEKAGQTVRLVDVPANRTFGAWDNLHEHATGTEMSDALNHAAQRHHGIAGRIFVDRLAEDIPSLSQLYEELKASPAFAKAAGNGQQKRVAARFALLAFAGELATAFGLTGWQPGEATKATEEIFAEWCEAQGEGNREFRDVLAAVSTFIEKHGDSRFSDSDVKEVSVHNRAGWWHDMVNGREYLLTSAGMHDVLKDYDFNRGLKLLQEAGVLPPSGADGKSSSSVMIKAIGTKKRVYRINVAKLENLHGG